MKKILYILILGICLSLTGCGETAGNEIVEGKEEEKNTIEGPITVEMVRGYKVADATDFVFTEYSDSVKITKYVGNDEIVVVPETINGKPVTEMMDLVFGNESQVRGLLLPETITEISALTANNQLIEVIICEGVQIVGNYCFVNSPKLRVIVFGEDLVDLGKAPFTFCKELREIYVPSEKVYLEEYKIPNLFYDTPDVTVYGIAESSMEEYAKRNNVKFVAQY